jgi:hypothetical protein
METYNLDGIPIFARIRYAMQYTNNINDWLKVMTFNGNGAYSNEWLIGNAKTGEICSLQLGCYHWDVERTFNGFIGSNHKWILQISKVATALPNILRKNNS